MTHKGVLQTESKTRWESLETQSSLRSAADRCAVADHPSVMLPRKDVIYPNQRQKGLFYFTANPKVFARARLSGTPHMEQKIERSRAKCKSLTQQKLFLNSLLNDAFLGVPPPPNPKSLIMSWRVFYDLRHVSHDAPSVCPAVTEGPASSHSCRTAPSLTSACCYLYIKTMLCQSELVCPSPWVEPRHYFTQTQEKKIWFSTCYRKCNSGMSS